MKKLMFQKELTLIKQVHQNNACFVFIGILKMLDLNLNCMFVINDVLITAYELKKHCNINCKRSLCILWGISKSETVNIFGNSVLEDKGVLQMDFGANKTPVEVSKEAAFGGTYFAGIYSGVNGKWYRKSWKEYDELRDIDQKYYYSNYSDVSVNKYGLKYETSLRFWEDNG